MNEYQKIKQQYENEEITKKQYIEKCKKLDEIQNQTPNGDSYNNIRVDHNNINDCNEIENTKILVVNNLGKNLNHSDYKIACNKLFSQIENILKDNEMEVKDIARTWFYNENVTKWYDIFNKERDEWFKKHNIKNSPASTCVGQNNKYNSPILANFMAIKKKNDTKAWKTVKSPLQDHPKEYGSSFARATEYNVNNQNILLISGTASINKNGKTLFENSAEKQIQYTMKVIKELLNSKNMTLENITTSTVYAKNEKVKKEFEKWLMQNNTNLIHNIICADICRNELLFEIEAEALKIIHERKL